MTKGIKVSSLKKYGIELVEGDVISIKGEPLKRMVLTDETARFICDTSNVDNMIFFAWRDTPKPYPESCHFCVEFDDNHNWRPDMDWLIEQENQPQTETPEEKASLDKVNTPSLTSDLSEIKAYLDDDKPTFTHPEECGGLNKTMKDTLVCNGCIYEVGKVYVDMYGDLVRVTLRGFSILFHCIREDIYIEPENFPSELIEILDAGTVKKVGRTQRDIDIEQMHKDAEYLYNADSPNVALQRLYDAGYRKFK